MACAVGLANLEIIEREGLVERVRDDTGPYFARRCRTASPAMRLVGETRALGLMGAIEIVRDKATRERFLPAGTAAAWCATTRSPTA